jgi:hypothetical protein
MIREEAPRTSRCIVRRNSCVFVNKFNPIVLLIFENFFVNIALF